MNSLEKSIIKVLFYITKILARVNNDKTIYWHEIESIEKFIFQKESEDK